MFQGKKDKIKNFQEHLCIKMIHIATITTQENLKLFNQEIVMNLEDFKVKIFIKSFNLSNFQYQNKDK